MTQSLTHFLPLPRLRDLLDRMQVCRVGVIGDLALDAYWTVDMTRALLSRETPRFPRPVVRERYAPGAGGNVAQNLVALNPAQVTVFSVLGEDWRGDLLRRELTARGIDTGALIQSPERSTTAYIKPLLTGYESQQEDARLDFENTRSLSHKLEEALIRTIERRIEDLDALIVTDQLEMYGVITDRVRQALIDLAARYPDRVVVADSRARIAKFSHMVLKPNWREAATASDYDPGIEDPLAQVTVARALAERTQRPVFLTLSGKGVLVVTGEQDYRLPAAPVTPPLDPVGAGDTFVATMATALAAGATPAEAGALANLAAAVVVEKLNETGTASPDEILLRWSLAQQVGQ
ncbi:MAG: PfkB family carbohydrate kinase [Anaerolineae bacterium]|nr:PfkB family carbohydrate kinase [Anaerolineae bacterium]